MTVVDAIGALPRTDLGGTFNEIPLRNYTSGSVSLANVITAAVKEATLFPSGTGPSVLTLSVSSTAPTVASTVISGTTLTLSPLAAGSATVTVRATDSNGNAATGTFVVTVGATIEPPAFLTQPVSQTIATGSTVVFNAPATGASSYRWERNGVTVPGATSDTLVLSNTTNAQAGSYVAIATSASASIRSNPATLTVIDVGPLAVSRLINLSLLTTAGSGARILTVGAVIGRGDGNTALPLVIRAVGPTIGRAPFNVPGVLADPVLTLFAQGTTTPIDTNDNWGGAAGTSAAFDAVGAFALPTDSLDSALVRTTPGLNAGGYSVQVTGKGGASGTVIAEIYDAAGSARTVNTPRLINLSSLAQIDAGTDLAVGFVIGGQTARSVLVRGVGPGLALFNVPGLMADPHLELFNNNDGRKLSTNEDWSGSTELTSASTAVGAFQLTLGSKDAVLLITLPPGAYTARIAGAAGSGGTAIVEIYEVP